MFQIVKHILDRSFIEICSYAPNWQLWALVTAQNIMMPMRPQTWNEGGRIQWRMYASLALNEFFWFGIG